MSPDSVLYMLQGDTKTGRTGANQIKDASWLKHASVYVSISSTETNTVPFLEMLMCVSVQLSHRDRRTKIDGYVCSGQNQSCP